MGPSLRSLSRELTRSSPSLPRPLLPSPSALRPPLCVGLLQTKSAWAKQMAAFDKLDLKKAKKEARFKKNHPVPVVEAPKGKKGKKNRFEGEEEE